MSGSAGCRTLELRDGDKGGLSTFNVCGTVLNDINGLRLYCKVDNLSVK